jgi:sugar/nucleoside kinase (ribokinase family)
MPTIQADILMVGHFAKDKLIVDGVEEVASGGAVYYGSVVLRRLGLDVAVATRLSLEDFPRLKELTNEGIQVFATPASETSGIANYYQSSDMERRICKPIGFAGPMQRADLPEGSFKTIMIASIIAGEVDLSMLKYLAGKAPVGLDIQGFVRKRVGDDLIFQPWKDAAEGLKYVTYLKVDQAEAEYLTGLTNHKHAAAELTKMGPKEIVLTQSSGVTVYMDGQYFEAPFNPRSLVGRTGRGDTCFSTYIGMRLNHSPETACQWAGAITTMKQEKPGPWKGTVKDVERYLAGNLR